MILKATIALAVVAALLGGCSSEGAQKHGRDHAKHSSPHGDDGMHAANAPAAGTNAECPVMGGEVEPDIFVEYRGKKVLFCCESCIDDFEENPDRFFAKAYPDAR